MRALSLTPNVRGHGFQMHHYRDCAGDPLKNWRFEPLSLAYFSLRRQREVGAAPHRGNANRPITIQGKANAAGIQPNKRRAGKKCKERPTPRAYKDKRRAGKKCKKAQRRGHTAEQAPRRQKSARKGQRRRHTEGQAPRRQKNARKGQRRRHTDEQAPRRQKSARKAQRRRHTDKQPPCRQKKPPKTAAQSPPRAAPLIIEHSLHPPADRRNERDPERPDLHACQKLRAPHHRSPLGPRMGKTRLRGALLRREQERLLDPVAAAERHGHPAHGPRVQPDDHGRPHPLSPHAR